jgi:hypothetical protein
MNAIAKPTKIRAMPAFHNNSSAINSPTSTMKLQELGSNKV